jgi:hypothetical protein
MVIPTWIISFVGPHVAAPIRWRVPETNLAAVIDTLRFNDVRAFSVEREDD